jgi:hypothetical protein
MFGVTGTGFAMFKTWQNEGKRPRYSLDQWDKVCTRQSSSLFIELTISQQSTSTLLQNSSLYHGTNKNLQ